METVKGTSIQNGWNDQRLTSFGSLNGTNMSIRRWSSTAGNRKDSPQNKWVLVEINRAGQQAVNCSKGEATIPSNVEYILQLVFTIFFLFLLSRKIPYILNTKQYFKLLYRNIFPILIIWRIFASTKQSIKITCLFVSRSSASDKSPACSCI